MIKRICDTLKIWGEEEKKKKNQTVDNLENFRNRPC